MKSLLTALALSAAAITFAAPTAKANPTVVVHHRTHRAPVRVTPVRVVRPAPVRVVRPAPVRVVRPAPVRVVRPAPDRVRVRNGVVQGQIGPMELRHLRAEQRRIASIRARMMADGVLTPAERRRLRVLEVRSDRHIYVARHN